ncbi:MAG: DUF1330 domain-containing protein [Candidatus Methanofastidiosa archaeon]|nr:DUF1330 domain-containing protein [Candidatus Methanofastidiosa archaeon]
MSFYMIVEPKDIIDKETYKEYTQKVLKNVEKYGGRYLTRNGEVSLIEGNWKPERLVIIEFESKDKFETWWNSPEYREIAILRERSAKVNAIVVQGI